MNKALFLDRDGVINVKLADAYVRNPDEFQLIPEILPILRDAHRKGYLLIVVSNQQGVGKGLMTITDLDDVHAYMQQVLRKADAPTIDALYTCTDLAGTNSTHRKPAPGMLLDALREHRIDASTSWFIGDSLTDARAGRAAGVHTALVGAYAPDQADVVAASHAELHERLMRLL